MSASGSPAAGPMSISQDDPEMVVADCWGVAHGHIENDWSGIDRPEVMGVKRPALESLGNVPMTIEYAEELRGHQQVEEVWCSVAGPVETTTRGRLPGRIVGVAIETEDALFMVNYVGTHWYACHPMWFAEHMADREAERAGTDIKSVAYFESFEDYRQELDSPGAPGAGFDYERVGEVSP